MKTNSDFAELHKNYYRPAKYLIPAAIFAATLLTGCPTDAPGTDNQEDENENSPGITPMFKTPVEKNLTGGISSFSYYAFHPAVADYDGDGDMDLFLGVVGADKTQSVSAERQKIVYYRNGGEGGFNVFEYDSAISFSLRSETVGMYAPSNSILISAGNIDEDADIELIGEYNINDHGTEFLWQPHSYYSGSFQVSNTSFSGGNRASTYADVDNDGDLDIVKGNNYYFWSSGPSSSDWGYKANIKYSLNDGYGTFESEQILVPATIVDDFNYIPVPSFVDADADGDQDMFVVVYESGEIIYYRNDSTYPDDVFTPDFTEITVPTDFDVIQEEGVKYFPTFVDADNDNDIDIIVGTDDARLLFFENTTN